MSDLLRSFLDDIVAHPEDTSLWLILADWLEDQNDPRAELVRLTWALSHEPDHADFAVRQARLQALLAGGLVPVRPGMALGGIEFTWIPPGSFLMGSPADEAERSDSQTRHRVKLTRPFWLGVYPVMQTQWLAMMGKNPSYFSRNGGGKDRIGKISDLALERFPVESVSWEMAEDFCKKLGERLGRGVVLPTEAEWEYACRAGTTTPYHFGSALDGTQANCDGNYPYGAGQKGPFLRRPTPVGSYPANAYGLHDMHGNVWEWCADGNDTASYSSSNRINSVFSSNDRSTPRVLRGGSWDRCARFCRAAYRIHSEASYGIHNFGFRVALRLD